MELEKVNEELHPLRYHYLPRVEQCAGKWIERSATGTVSEKGCPVFPMAVSDNLGRSAERAAAHIKGVDEFSLRFRNPRMLCRLPFGQGV